MSKGFATVLLLLAFGVAVGVVGYLRFVVGGDEDQWVCQQGKWVAHGNPTGPIPNTPCGQSQEPGPKDVVEGFYNWYLAQNDGAIDISKREELADSYKLKVEQIRMSNTNGGVDPILLAQDKPDSIDIGNPVAEGPIARVQVDEDFFGNTQTLMVALAKDEGSWKITDIQSVTDLTPLSPDNTKKVVIYFSNPRRSMGSTECGVVFGVERTVAKDAGYDARLRHLFLGPTTNERQEGYSSMFSKATANILKSVKIHGRTAYVDLKDIRSIIPNASASCGSQEFFAEVGETLKHERQIDNVIYAIEGNPETFYEWMQLGCSRETNNCDKTPFN